MNNTDNLKEIVKEKYGEIANQDKATNETSCCGVGGCATVDYTIFSEDYSQLKGYNADADLGLGCGIPTAFAQISEGQTVLDLGSGAGNDCFVAREIVGEKGKVIGVDFTDNMIEKARENADKLGFNNVEFRKGDIEQMPVGGNSIDVVISNCVLNLVPNKQKAFSETYRVLKPGGHFSVSDVVLKGNLPEKLKNDAEMYAGCVSGAIQMDEYLNIILETGFTGLEVKKEKMIMLPDEILEQYLNGNEIEKYKSGAFGIFSITVYGQKTGDNCCDPASGCC
jgi:arsenite methyltransferase